MLLNIYYNISHSNAVDVNIIILQHAFIVFLTNHPWAVKLKAYDDII
jgi:hypothetical protein